MLILLLTRPISGLARGRASPSDLKLRQLSRLAMLHAFVAGCQVARLPSGARSKEMPFLTLSARIVGASNALKTKLVAVNDEEVLLCGLTQPFVQL